jgi:hypothetical protein
MNKEHGFEKPGLTTDDRVDTRLKGGSTKMQRQRCVGVRTCNIAFKAKQRVYRSRSVPMQFY